jgi:hypothetical protein
MDKLHFTQFVKSTRFKFFRIFTHLCILTKSKINSNLKKIKFFKYTVSFKIQ